MSDNLPAVTAPAEDTVQLGVISASSPQALVARATEAADALAAVIKAKRLFSSIQGKQYVRCEGWTTLAAMMGCLPREVSNVSDPDGRYVATVELVRMGDGAVLTRASAECGPDEPTWKGRSLYARRSMAATRATSKACRLAFSWVMALAGYEVTPAEEIPSGDDGQRTRHDPRKLRSEAIQSQPLDEKPLVLQQPMPNILALWPYKSTGDKGIAIRDLTVESLRAKIKWLDDKIERGLRLAEQEIASGAVPAPSITMVEEVKALREIVELELDAKTNAGDAA